MENVFNSEIYHWICFILHIIEVLILAFGIYLVFFSKHYEKIEEANTMCYISEGGEEYKKSVRYKNSRIGKIFEKLIKLFK